MNTIRAFLSKIRTPFLIFKKSKGGLLSLPSCSPVSVAEYASISLKIFLNILKMLE